jgi:hypothetical protein
MLKLVRILTSGPFGTVRQWRHDRLGDAIVETITYSGRKGSADIIRAHHLAKVTSQRRKDKASVASARRRRSVDDRPKPAA